LSRHFDIKLASSRLSLAGSCVCTTFHLRRLDWYLCSCCLLSFLHRTSIPLAIMTT
jgi:hypothetical protein